jgi:hypothetical protein
MDWYREYCKDHNIFQSIETTPSSRKEARKLKKLIDCALRLTDRDSTEKYLQQYGSGQKIIDWMIKKKSEQ